MDIEDIIAALQLTESSPAEAHIQLDPEDEQVCDVCTHIDPLNATIPPMTFYYYIHNHQTGHPILVCEPHLTQVLNITNSFDYDENEY